MRKADKVEHVPLASLVFDETFYPRWRVDALHVRRLADALRSGETLPPLEAHRTTKRLIDGAHRGAAYRQVEGPDAVVPVIWLDGEDAELFRRMLTTNSRHGLPFRSIDLRRISILAERFALSDEELVRELHIPIGRIIDLKGGRATRNGEEIPLKGSMSYLAGEELTPAQASVIDVAPGINVPMLATQLTRLVRAGAVDLDNERVVRALTDLRDALSMLPIGVSAA